MKLVHVGIYDGFDEETMQYAWYEDYIEDHHEFAFKSWMHTSLDDRELKLQVL